MKRPSTTKAQEAEFRKVDPAILERVDTVYGEAYIRKDRPEKSLFPVFNADGSPALYKSDNGYKTWWSQEYLHVANIITAPAYPMVEGEGAPQFTFALPDAPTQLALL